MVLVVDSAQPSLEDVRIDLCRREIGVPEHDLDGAEIGAALEQMRSKGMAQYVRTQLARDPGLRPIAFEDFPESDT
jgi:hypothetical protein